MVMRIWTILACALSLTSCFSSEKPLFDEARGACPFQTPTLYIDAYEEAPRPILFERDGAYCRFSDLLEGSVRALYVPSERDWWIVQSDEPRPIYTLVHRSGRRLLQYQPLCSDFSTQRLRALGVDFDKRREWCIASQPSQLETLFRSWRSPLRQPTSVLRREDDARLTV
jgi:hypothetical protein